MAIKFSGELRISAYNFGRRLKTLKGLTPHEFICKQWTLQPQRFTRNPIHKKPRLNNHLNDLFEYRVEALTTRDDLDFDALIGTRDGWRAPL